LDFNFEFRKPIPITKNINGSTRADNIAISTSDKKISTPSAMPTFNFSDNLDKNKSNNSLSFTVPKSKETTQSPKAIVNKEISKPSVELKSGSVMDVLMKFKNEKVKEDDAKIENLNNSITEHKPLTDIFKPKTGTWECDACMIRNDASLTKCVACETPKPGSQNNTSSSSIPLNPFQTTVVSAKDDLFKKLVEKQNEKWECSTCDTRNESSRNKCICCEQAKPGAEISEPKFSFGNVEPKFSFGIPTDALVSVATTALVTKETKSSAPSFTFGVTPTWTVPASKPVDIFGMEASSTPIQPTIPMVPTATPSGFTFGYIKEADKIDAPKPANSDDKTEKVKSKPTVTSMFGSPVSSSSGSLTSNITPPVAIDSKPVTSDTSNKSETSSFIFGIQNVTKSTESPLIKPLSENSTTPATTNSNSSVGGFKFTPPNNSSPLNSTVVSSNIESKSLNTTPASEASTTTVLGQQVTPTFGQTSGFSLFKKPETSSPLAITPLVTKTETNPTVPTFGSISRVNKIESTVAPQISNEVTPVTTTSFVFGTPTNSTAIKSDNIFGSSTINPAPPVTTSAPTFGSSSGFGFPTATTTTNSSITSPFSGFGSNTSTPTIDFGTKLTQTPTGTFGSFGGGNSTNQSPATTNSATPVFGSFVDSTVRSSNLDSTNSTAFGQPTKTFGIRGGATESSATSSGFGANIFGQNTPSATFGSQTSANFGTQPVTVQPTFGATATPFNPPQQQNDTAPTVKNVFQFGGALQTNEQQQPTTNNLFQFGAANNSSNIAPKASFNFSTTTPSSFNFTATAPPATNSAQPFTFGAPEPQPPGASGGFNFGSSSIEVASNSPFQFGTPASNNPFAATPAGPPRRKMKPARRLR
jgi:nuclear pore complex protein Nup153